MSGGMRMLLKSEPSERYWRWVSTYAYETSLVVITASQVLALLTVFAAGAPLGNRSVPGWLTLVVAAMFAVCTGLLVAAMIVGTSGFMATALRSTVAAFATTAGMVIPGGLNGPEAVLMVQAIPYMILTLARACYFERVWQARAQGAA